MISCGTHPTVDARHACSTCRTQFCDACVTAVGPPGKQVAQCKRCGGLATPLTSPLSPHRARVRAIPAGTLASRLPGTLAYLGGLDLLFTLAGLAVLVALLKVGGFLFGLFALGLECVVAFRIVSTSGAGADRFEAPDGDELGEVMGAAVRYLVALLPLILSLVWFAMSTHAKAPVPSPGTLLANLGPPALAILASIILWPLFTVIAAMSNSSLAILNPLIWVKTLRIMGRDYVVGALAFYAVFALEIFAIVPLAAAVNLAIPFVGIVLALFITYLPLALRARILGELVRPYYDP